MNHDISTLFGVDIAAQSATVARKQAGHEVSVPLQVAQTDAAIEQFIIHMTKLGEPEETLVVLEATGTYWMRLALALHEAGFVVSVINPLQARRFAQMHLRRAKTDAIDAQLLAELAAMLQPAAWTPPPAIYDELQQRLAQRDALSETLGSERNRRHALLQRPNVVASVRERLEAHIAFLQTQLAAIDREIEAILQNNHAWQDSLVRLRSIPGIGPLTASWILTATLNFAYCDTPEQAVSYAGLAPHARDSGASIRGRRSVGGGGHARLRRALYMAAVSAVRFNPIIRSFYQRLLARGKPPKVALCAAARKLFCIAWAVVTKERMFDPNFATQPT